MLELIIGSESFSDFIDRKEYRNVIQGHLQEVTDKISSLKKSQEKRRGDLNKAKMIQNVIKESLERQRTEKQANLEQLKEEERIIRDKFAARLNRSGVKKYCAGQGEVVRAKYPIFQFPVSCGYVSQGYGMTEFAAVDRAYNGAIHNGIDVGVGTGTPIYSIGNGTVYGMGSSPAGGWGNWIMVKQDKVKIENNEFEFYALYAHMVTETPLKVGDKVTQNTLMGMVGGTPNWAPHLHFSLFMSPSGWSDVKYGPYPGNTVDPLNYMDVPISTIGTDWDPSYLHK